MKIEDKISNIKIDSNYKRNNINCYLDTFRKKLVPATREELVRQRIAIYFRDILKVPTENIHIEESLRRWGINSNNRADIVISYESEKNMIRCLGVVECKADNVELSAQTFNQCEGYLKKLDGKYLFITNGIDIFAWILDDNGTYKKLSKLPDYQEMLCSECEILKYDSELYLRRCIEELDEMNESEFIDSEFIGEDTPKHLYKHILNIGECFFDESHRIQKQKMFDFEILDDLGLSYLSYRDASGGNFGTGYYRELLIKDYNGNHQIIGFSIMSTGKTVDSPVYGNSKGKSVLVVSFQDFDNDYTVVQINLNEYLNIESDKLSLRHNGAVKMKGANKSDLLDLLSKRYPSIIKNNKIYLGSWSCDELLYMDSKDFSESIGRIIAYSLVRNEYKNFIKKLSKNQAT